MNETIGVKGGKRDQKRRLIITKNQKKRLEEYQKELDKYELEKLEKRVKQLQRATLVKTLPIVVTGQIIEAFSPYKEKNEEIKDFIPISSEEKTTSKDNIKVISTKKDILKDKVIIRETIKGNTKATQKEPSKEDKYVEVKVEEQKEIIIPTTNIKAIYQDEINDLKKTQEQEIKDINIEKLSKLKNRKIIDEYEKNLKDIRYDLRNLLFEYQVLEDQSDDLYQSKEAEELLEKLSIVINKIDELKRKIQIEDLDKYDDNYIYSLIEDYIEEFKENNAIDEIKDSELYIMISSKLEELEDKKENLNQKVTDRKEELEIKEEDFEKMKEKYSDVEKLNNDLFRFQQEQEHLLNEIKRKIDNAVTEEEKISVQMKGLTKAAKRAMRLMTAQMMIPGLRGAAGLTAVAGSYLYLMKHIINAETITKKYKVIKVADYKFEIESSIKALDVAKYQLKDTSKQVDDMIKSFKNDYKEFFDIIPECKKLLSDMEKMKEELEEKEFEVQRMQKEQERALVVNNAKVKLRGQYEM